MRAHRLKGILALGLLAAWLPAQAQTVRYVHTDALGSPVAMTDANRVVVERRQYEPYGKRLNASNNDRPGYTGHVEDAATGLTYMQQRYYDPGIGIFLSVDPVTAYSDPISQFHRYRYANNNPYRFTDPDGRCAASRLQAVCAMGATMFNSAGLRAQPTFRQAQMVRIVSDRHGSANSAAVAFGKATQKEARDSQREPQSGIVRSGENNYAYTNPMWGAHNDTAVDVKHYVEALTYVYGSSAIGLAHTHILMTI